MPYRRRDVLIGAAAVAAGCTVPTEPPTPPVPLPARDPSPQPPVVAGAADTDLFPWGVVVGEVLGGSALIRVRAVDAAACELWLTRYDDDWTEPESVDLEPLGFTFSTTLAGLQGDTVYAVWAMVGDVRSRVTRFRTAPTGGVRRKISFGATSCLSDANPDMQNLGFVGDHDLDLFLLLGDAVYADGSITREDYESSWDWHFRRPVMGELFASTSVLSIWDDHEVANNWTLVPNQQGTISQEQFRAAVEVMNEVLPQRDGPAGRYRTHRWGEDVEFFLLDCRGDRTPGQMVSIEQLAWFVDRLNRSTARIKIVLSSVHVTDHFDLLSTIQVADRWQGFPEQRAALVSALVAVPGTFVITGDMHFGSVQGLDPEGPGRTVTEVAAGPSGSFLAPVDGLVELIGERPAHYSVLLEEWSWCRFDVDPGTGQVDVQFIGDEGTVLASFGFVV